MLAILVPTASTVAAAGEADPLKGRELAQQHCSRCHVVGDFNPTGGISSTPSFQMLVRRRPDYRERFQTFYARRPHPAFIVVKGVGKMMEHLPPNAAPVEITPEDVENVAAFAATLAPKSGAPGEPVIFRARPKPRTR